MAEPPITILSPNTDGANGPVTRIVIHCTESPSTAGRAHRTALYFGDAHPSDGRRVSAHYIEDAGFEEHCVPESVQCRASPPNHGTISIEINGYSLYTQGDWLAGDAFAALVRASLRTADVCSRHGIPAIKLSAADLRNNPHTQGICGHIDVCQSGLPAAANIVDDHGDPGPGFPWEDFLWLVRSPWISEVTPNIGKEAGGDTITITGTGFNDTIDVSVGPSSVSESEGASLEIVSDTELTVVTPPGSGIVDVIVTTPAGVSATGASTLFTYGDAAGPELVDVSPRIGSAAGGDAVELTGSGLFAVTDVSFGASSAASVTAVSATQVVAVTPPGDPGTVDITVTTPAGTTAVSASTSFTYLEDVPTADGPSISEIIPQYGNEVGGEAVLIRGTGLDGISDVSFGPTSVESISSASETELIVVTPPGKGVADVVATTSDGSSATSDTTTFTYMADPPAHAPIVTDVSPRAGSERGDDTVVVTGRGFADFTDISFGSSSVASTANASDTEVTVTTPAGTGTVDVVVTTPVGDSGASGEQAFTYLPDAGRAGPIVTDVSPRTGSSEGGDTLEISGSGLAGVTDVSVGPSSVLQISQTSDTALTVLSPPGDGSVDVVVTTDDGVSATSDASTFTYL